MSVVRIPHFSSSSTDPSFDHDQNNDNLFINSIPDIEKACLTNGIIPNTLQEYLEKNGVDGSIKAKTLMEYLREYHLVPSNQISFRYYKCLHKEKWNDNTMLNATDAHQFLNQLINLEMQKSKGTKSKKTATLRSKRSKGQEKPRVLYNIMGEKCVTCSDDIIKNSECNNISDRKNCSNMNEERKEQYSGCDTFEYSVSFNMLEYVHLHEDFQSIWSPGYCWCRDSKLQIYWKKKELNELIDVCGLCRNRHHTIVLKKKNYRPHFQLRVLLSLITQVYEMMIPNSVALIDGKFQHPSLFQLSIPQILGKLFQQTYGIQSIIETNIKLLLVSLSHYAAQLDVIAVFCEFMAVFGAYQSKVQDINEHTKATTSVQIDGNLPKELIAMCMASYCWFFQRSLVYNGNNIISIKNSETMEGYFRWQYVHITSAVACTQEIMAYPLVSPSFLKQFQFSMSEFAQERPSEPTNVSPKPLNAKSDACWIEIHRFLRLLLAEWHEQHITFRLAEWCLFYDVKPNKENIMKKLQILLTCLIFYDQGRQGVIEAETFQLVLLHVSYLWFEHSAISLNSQQQLLLIKTAVVAIKKRFSDREYDGKLCYIDFWTMLYIVGMQSNKFIGMADIPSFCYDYLLEIKPSLAVHAVDYMLRVSATILPLGFLSYTTYGSKDGMAECKQQYNEFHSGEYSMAQSTSTPRLAVQELLNNRDLKYQSPQHMYIDGTAYLFPQNTYQLVGYSDSLKYLNPENGISKSNDSRLHNTAQTTHSKKDPTVIHRSQIGIHESEAFAVGNNNLINYTPVIKPLIYKECNPALSVANNHQVTSRTSTKTNTGLIASNQLAGLPNNAEIIMPRRYEKAEWLEQMLKDQDKDQQLLELEGRKANQLKQIRISDRLRRLKEQKEQEKRDRQAGREMKNRLESEKKLRKLRAKIVAHSVSHRSNIATDNLPVHQKHIIAKIKSQPYEDTTTSETTNNIVNKTAYFHAKVSFISDIHQIDVITPQEELKNADSRITIESDADDSAQMMDEVFVEGYQNDDSHISPSGEQSDSFSGSEDQEEFYQFKVNLMDAIAKLRSTSEDANHKSHDQAEHDSAQNAITSQSTSSVGSDAICSSTDNDKGRSPLQSTPKAELLSQKSENPPALSNLTTFESKEKNDMTKKTPIEVKVVKPAHAITTPEVKQPDTGNDVFSHQFLLRTTLADASKSPLKATTFSEDEESPDEFHVEKPNDKPPVSKATSTDLSDHNQTDGNGLLRLTSVISIAGALRRKLRDSHLNDEAEQALYGKKEVKPLGEEIVCSSARNEARNTRWAAIFEETEKRLISPIKLAIQRRENERMEADFVQNQLAQKHLEELEQDFARLERSHRRRMLLATTEDKNDSDEIISFRKRRLARETSPSFISHQLSYGTSVSRSIERGETKPLYFHFYYDIERHGTILTVKLLLHGGEAIVCMSTDTPAPCPSDCQWHSIDSLSSSNNTDSTFITGNNITQEEIADQGSKIVLYPQQLKLAVAQVKYNELNKFDNGLIANNARTYSQKGICFYLAVVPTAPDERETLFSLGLMVSGQQAQESSAMKRVNQFMQGFYDFSKAISGSQEQSSIVLTPSEIFHNILANSDSTNNAESPKETEVHSVEKMDKILEPVHDIDKENETLRFHSLLQKLDEKYTENDRNSRILTRQHSMTGMLEPENFLEDEEKKIQQTEDTEGYSDVIGKLHGLKMRRMHALQKFRRSCPQLEPLQDKAKPLNNGVSNLTNLRNRITHCGIHRQPKLQLTSLAPIAYSLSNLPKPKFGAK